MIASLLALTLLNPASALADDIKVSGDVLQIVIPAAGLGMTAYHRDLWGAGMWAASGAATGVVTWSLKLAIDRDRPGGGGFGQSMPSGHAAVSAWGAGFIHRRYGWKPAIPAYLAAGYVAWTRVQADYHRPEEVIVGAAIGVLSSFLLTRRWEPPKDDEEESVEDAKLISFVPLVSRGFYGLQIGGRW